MESLITTVIVIAIVAILIVIANKFKPAPEPQTSRRVSPYYRYTRKSYIMTEPEAHFYRRLQNIANDKYLVFPQIHLSSLANNITAGKYRKLGFQRINRRSVDYVLADIETLQTVYTVELDDRTHDTQKGKYSDALKQEILEQIQVPLVRFRNVRDMTDEDIIESFKSAKRF